MTMTFGELHAAVAALLADQADRTFNVRVEAWNEGSANSDRLQWTAWLAGKGEHVYATNPELLLERVRAVLSSTAPKTEMRPADVVL